MLSLPLAFCRSRNKTRKFKFLLWNVYKYKCTMRQNSKLKWLLFFYSGFTFSSFKFMHFLVCTKSFFHGKLSGVCDCSLYAQAWTSFEKALLPCCRNSECLSISFFLKFSISTSLSPYYSLVPNFFPFVLYFWEPKPQTICKCSWALSYCS